MSINLVEAAFKTYGPIAATLIVICILLFFILRWVFKNQDNILCMAKSQNEAWQKVIQEHTENAKVFYIQVIADHSNQKDAGNYQREEHIKMMDSLNGIVLELKSMNGKKQ